MIVVLPLKQESIRGKKWKGKKNSHHVGQGNETLSLYWKGHTRRNLRGATVSIAQLHRIIIKKWNHMKLFVVLGKTLFNECKIPSCSWVAKCFLHLLRASFSLLQLWLIMRDDAKRAPLLGVMCCILCKIFRFFLKLTAWPRKIWDTFAKNAT